MGRREPPRVPASSSASLTVACASSSAEKLRAWRTDFSATNGCILRRDAISLERTPSSASAATLRTRTTWLTSEPTTRISSPERGLVRALEQRLRRAERAGDVAASPRVGDGEDRRLGAADGELLDDGTRDRLAVRPRGELLDLGGEVADVLPDGLDERAAGVAVSGRAEPRELLADPLRQLLLRRPRTCAPRRPCPPPSRARRPS